MRTNSRRERPATPAPDPAQHDRQQGRTRDVAIVGMACVLPDAPDVEAFWANVVDGVDSVAEVAPSRWDPELHYDPDYDPSSARSGTQPRSVSKWGGWIPDVGFDALAWGIPPTSLASIDPAQLLALKVAAAALDDAGYGDPGTDRDHTSLVFATGSGGASELPAGFQLRLQLRSHHAGALPEELDAFLPQLTEDGLPGVLTSLIAGRVANRLNLGGKNLTVDSACASVLVALDIACSELRAGTSDTVLCGGVDLHNGVQDFVSFTAAGALSRGGRCRSFDADADGMVLAEGAGCLVLKRVEDAERDRDRIYAVVKGVAGSSDGRHLGLTAPRQEGQVKAVWRTYESAGISPAEIGLLEAHGTGTPAGDRTELATMTETFTAAGAAHRSVVLGSVKSNIGHVKCAAGIASLIKAAKAAYHGVLPPTLHVTEPNEGWDPATSPFVFLDQARPWLGDRRLVGVSAFGFGGTNFHAVVGNHASEPQPPSGRPEWPAELFLFRAPSRVALEQRLAKLAERLTAELDGPLQADRWRLRDIAAAESAAGAGPVRLALVANGLEDLARKVVDALHARPGDGLYLAAADPWQEPEVAFLFSRPAEAHLGQGADVLVAFPGQRAAARDERETIDALLPPQAFGSYLDQQRRALAGAADRATGLLSLTMIDTLVALGVRPVCALGPDVRPLPARPSRAPDLTASPADGATASTPRATTLATDAHAPASDAERQLDHDVRDLADQGVRVFVEVGPGRWSTDCASRALVDVPHLAVTTNRPGEHGLVSLLRTLGQLAVAGVPVDLEAMHAGRGSRPDHWRDPPRAPGWMVNGHCARTAKGEPLPGGLRPAHDAPTVRLDGAPASPPGGDGGDQEAALGDVLVATEYLRLVHGIIATSTELLREPTPPAGGRNDR